MKRHDNIECDDNVDAHKHTQRGRQAARAQLGGRNYPFASFLPRFWLQEIVEELDNSTVATADVHNNVVFFSFLHSPANRFRETMCTMKMVLMVQLMHC